MPSTADRITPVRTRRSWTWIAGATALILVGGIVNVFIFSSSSHPNQVFAVAQNISRGATITKDDLTTIDLASGQITAAISATDSSDVIGKIATVDLPKGSLVIPAAISTTQSVPEGMALVGLSLKPAQLPAQQLAAGDQVQIVPVATDMTGQVSVNTTTVTGTVADTSTSQSTGTTIVDVYVSETVAADLTSRAAAGAVAIYLTPTNG